MKRKMQDDSSTIVEHDLMNKPDFASSVGRSVSLRQTDAEILRYFEEDRIGTLKDERAAVQKKVFTRWMNSQLKSKGMKPIEDLYVDVRDGKSLIDLMSALTGKNLKANTGNLRVHKVENIQSCLSLLEKLLDVKIIGINAVDIADGCKATILSLLWFIILNQLSLASDEDDFE